MKLIAEVHNKADYSGSNLGNVWDFDGLLEACKQHCEIINVVTEPSLWWDFNLLAKVRSKISLSISLLHFQITDDIIDRAADLWNGYVIVIYWYNKENLWKIIQKSRQKWVQVIIEIENIQQAEDVLNFVDVSIIWINTRNLQNLGEIDFQKVPWIVQYLKSRRPDIRIIWESWLDHNHRRIWLGVDSWIVWSAIIKSRVPIKSVGYFWRNEVNIPYIFLESWFIHDDEKVNQFLLSLQREGFNIYHTSKGNNWYEIWFLVHSSLDLRDSYNVLKSLAPRGIRIPDFNNHREDVMRVLEKN